VKLLYIRRVQQACASEGEIDRYRSLGMKLAVKLSLRDPQQEGLPDPAATYDDCWIAILEQVDDSPVLKCLNKELDDILVGDIFGAEVEVSHS
jgi:hypothetical protein